MDTQAVVKQLSKMDEDIRTCIEASNREALKDYKKGDIIEAIAIFSDWKEFYCQNIDDVLDSKHLKSHFFRIKEGA